ncbi:MAG TPA: Ig-like domain-containing protein, partial [Fibrobacteraceae bacterium]|nr:Ig-like domain-containing protein [Fibrobacteraceae bacterium]
MRTKFKIPQLLFFVGGLMVTVAGATTVGSSSVSSILIADFDTSEHYKCAATSSGGLYAWASGSASEMTNVTDSSGIPVGLLVTDTDGAKHGTGYANIEVYLEDEDPTEYPSGGFGVSFGSDSSRTYSDSDDIDQYQYKAVYDLSNLDSITFWAKGINPQRSWRVQLKSPLFSRTYYGTSSVYWDWYGYSIPDSNLSTSTWTKISIPVDSLTPSWTSSAVIPKKWALKYVTGIEFSGSVAEPEDPSDDERDAQLTMDLLTFYGMSALSQDIGVIPTLVNGTIDSNMTWSDTVVVIGDVTVSSSATLTVKPGTVVLFDSSYSLTVEGSLEALGTADDSIYFIPADTSYPWEGIRASGSVSLAYAHLSYGENDNGGCFYATGDSTVTVSNSLFYRCRATNGGAIFSTSDITIAESMFLRDSTYWSGNVWVSGTSTISRSQFLYNKSAGGAPAVYNNGGTARISSSLFANNQGSWWIAVAENEDENATVTKIFNSTFVNNMDSSYTASAEKGDPAVNADSVVNCIIRGSGSLNSVADSAKVYMDDDVAFADSAAGDFSLLVSSPAINAGLSSGLTLDSLDLAGNARVSIGNVDLGAYEYVNTAPSKTAIFTTVSWAEDSSSYTVTLGNQSGDTLLINHFTDAEVSADHDSLKVIEVSTSSNKFNVEWDTSSSSMTVTPVADSNGTDSIVITVADIDGDTASATMAFTLAARNDQPSVLLAEDTLITEKDTTFDLSSYFTDIDGDALTYSVSLSSSALGTATSVGNGFSLTVPESSSMVKGTVTVTVSDGKLNVSASYSLWLIPMDNAPVRDATIRDTTVQEDAANIVMNLNDNFSDKDTLLNPLTYTVQSLQGLVTPTISAAADDTTADDTLLTLELGANLYGNDTIVVTASDGYKWAADTFAVTIQSVNDVPTIADSIGAVTIVEDYGDTVIDLSLHFTDVESASLTYTAVTSDSSLISAVINGSNLTLSTQSNANGTDTVTVTAADDSSAMVAQKFVITVTAADDAPVLVAIPTDSIQEDTKDTIDLADYFSEVDGETLTYNVVDGSDQWGYLKSATLISGTSKLVITPISNSSGSDDSVIVSASDGTTDIADTFAVVVVAVNDLPTRSKTIPDTNGVEGDTISMSALTAYFSDVEDGVDLSFTTTSSDEDKVSIDDPTSSTPVLNLLEGGTVNIIVKAEDSEGAFVLDTFQVSVEYENTAPTRISQIADVSGLVGGQLAIDLTDYFKDAEDDSLAYTTISVDASVVSITNDTTSTPILSFLASGSTSVIVTATDDDGASVADTFTVTVEKTTVVLSKAFA